MIEPLQLGVFQDSVRLLESAAMHRKPDTAAGEEVSVVKETKGE